MHWAPGYKEEISSNHITMVLRKLAELEVTAIAAALFNRTLMLILSNHSICNGFLMFSFWSPERKGPCVSSNQLSTGQGGRMSWGSAIPDVARGPKPQAA